MCKGLNSSRKAEIKHMECTFYCILPLLLVNTQIKQTPASHQEGIAGTRFPLLPETTNQLYKQKWLPFGKTGGDNSFESKETNKVSLLQSPQLFAWRKIQGLRAERKNSGGAQSFPCVGMEVGVREGRGGWSLQGRALEKTELHTHKSSAKYWGVHTFEELSKAEEGTTPKH